MDDLEEQLDALPRGHAALIAEIAWDALRPNEAQRMRELGFDEGVRVEKLHTAPLGQDPIAVRVGRMTIAIRRAQAAMVRVVPLSAAGSLRGGISEPLAVAAE